MGQSIPGKLPRVPKGLRCPICKALAEAAFKPFCSSRCADVDLSRWLQGAYAIPGGGEDADEDGDDAHAGRRSKASSEDPDHEG